MSFNVLVPWELGCAAKCSSFAPIRALVDIEEIGCKNWKPFARATAALHAQWGRILLKSRICFFLSDFLNFLWENLCQEKKSCRNCNKKKSHIRIKIQMRLLGKILPQRVLQGRNVGNNEVASSNEFSNTIDGPFA